MAEEKKDLTTLKTQIEFTWEYERTGDRVESH